MMLSILDITVIVIYFLVLLLIGYFASKKETKEGYLIADRKTNVLTSVSTITATKVNSGLFLVYLAMVYKFGISAFWFFIGHIVGYSLFYFFASKIREQSSEKKYYTYADYFFNRFGKSVGYIVTLIILTINFLIFSVQIIAGAKILNFLTGFPYLYSLLIVSFAILSYIFLAGFKAVVFTDVFQFIGIIGILLIISYFFMANYSLIPSSFNLVAVGSQNIFGFLLAGIILPFGSAALWQRIYATKDKRTLQKSILISILSFFIVGLLLTLVGMAISTQVSGIDPDLTLLEGFKQLLPVGLIGLGVVFVFSAVMSSADSYLFVVGTSIVQDLIQKSKYLLKKDLIKKIRFSVLIVTLVGILFSYIFANLVGVSFLLTALNMSVGLIAIISWSIRRIKKQTVLFGLITGVISIFAFLIIKGAPPTILITGVVGVILGLILGKFASLMKKSVMY